jgi:polyhydroxyalkanoate synthesis repressor PhaR
MAKSDPVTIKKYANRRLYNTGTSTYVTLEDLAAMVKAGDDFLVYDAKSGDDITRSVLTQIIFEQEGKEGQNMLPVAFLRQLIRFYGDSMQLLVPRYLELSIDSLTKEQDKLRGQIGTALGLNPLVAPFEQQIRRNMEMFERAFSMFSPFGKREDGTSAGSPDLEPVSAAPAKAAEPAKEGDIDELKNQLADIQRKLEGLSRK